MPEEASIDFWRNPWEWLATVLCGSRDDKQAFAAQQATRGSRARSASYEDERSGETGFLQKEESVVVLRDTEDPLSPCQEEPGTDQPEGWNVTSMMILTKFDEVVAAAKVQAVWRGRAQRARKSVATRNAQTGSTPSQTLMIAVVISL